MAMETKSFKLMGSTITVTETYEGEFESNRRFIEGLRRSRYEFPMQVFRSIHYAGGTGLVFLMEKKLQNSDVDKYQNRIYVPKSEKLLKYLTEDERERIENSGDGLDVDGIDPKAKTYYLNIRKWKNPKAYALIKEWGKLVLDNGLQKDDSIEIWCYRVYSKLRVAIIAKSRTVHTGP